MAHPSGSTSSIRQLIPLLLIVLILSFIAWILYHLYLSATKLQASASERMGKKNVVFTRDGVRVGVKHVQDEKYVDATQSWVVKAWNLSSPNEVSKPQKKSK